MASEFETMCTRTAAFSEWGWSRSSDGILWLGFAHVWWKRFFFF